MKLVTKELIDGLASETAGPCVSIYMPAHRSHPENTQDAIRYKNLVKKVKASLTEKYPASGIQMLMEPFEALLNDHEFWNHTGVGLGVLGSPARFEVIRLQQPVEELVLVTDSFYTKPLRYIFQSQDRYQVLTLTMDAAHLFEGNRHSLSEIELAHDFPRTINEALGEELTEKHSTVASYGGVGGNSTNMHHGQGGKKDEVDSDAERFFRKVADAVHDRYSRPAGLPLLLAALPEYHHLFRRVNKNLFLLSKGIEIDPQAVSTEKLTELSWDVMQPIYIKKLETLGEKFSQAKSNGLGSDTLEEAIEAAGTGRVDTLLIEAHRVLASKLEDGVANRDEPNDFTETVLDDQLDHLGELVNKMGGTVVVMPKAQMPSDTGVAAIFRY